MTRIPNTNVVILDAFFGQCHIIPIEQWIAETLTEDTVIEMLENRKIKYSWADCLWCVSAEIIKHKRRVTGKKK